MVSHRDPNEGVQGSFGVIHRELRATFAALHILARLGWPPRLSDWSLVHRAIGPSGAFECQGLVELCLGHVCPAEVGPAQVGSL